MKFKIFMFKKVTSTNDIAINLIKNKKKEFGYVYAQTQTKGRGRYGRKWVSNKGNLFGTIFFQLKNNYPSFSEFTIINPIIISKVIRNFCSNKKITFKWPNDVLVNKKKICGILQEIITKNSKRFLIVGIGLNLTSNPNNHNKYRTTNIFSETNKKPPIKRVINLIINSYEDFFVNLSNYNYKNFKKKIQKITSNKIV